MWLAQSSITPFDLFIHRARADNLRTPLADNSQGAPFKFSFAPIGTCILYSNRITTATAERLVSINEQPDNPANLIS